MSSDTEKRAALASSPRETRATEPNEDTALLDALDKLREDVVEPSWPDGDPELVAHAWGIHGQCETVREALRAHITAVSAHREGRPNG